MKVFIPILLTTTIFAFSSCASVTVIEKNATGGTLKIRKRGITKESRHDKAISEADEHCKRNGFTSYKVENESQDGRHLIIRFSCVN